MHTFTDTRGRKWAVELTIGVMQRIKAALSVDLANINDESFQIIAADNLRLCEIIGHCSRVVASNGVSDEVPLVDTLAGDALGAARQAFIDELVAFFPSARERAALARVLEGMAAAKERALALVEQQIESGALDRTIDEAMAAAVGEGQRTPGASSGSSPASLASIPAS